jgi:hypothetical protein
MLSAFSLPDAYLSQVMISFAGSSDAICCRPARLGMVQMRQKVLQLLLNVEGEEETEAE